MNPLPLSKIADLAGATLDQGDRNALIERISTDSRTIKKGELFVALHGENFDAHKFIEDVAKTDAVGAIVDREWTGKVPKNFAIIRAEDTLLAYQNLAANYRKSLAIKVLAITGSNGKTSTKDFSASVLGRRFRVTKTQGNFNNHVGLPRTILDANSQDEVAVWEIGMNHPGEIGPLAQAGDLTAVTQLVNGGSNGLAERARLYKYYLANPAPAAPTSGSPGSTPTVSRTAPSNAARGRS